MSTIQVEEADVRMYYQGTIDILDRGDAPALEVLDKNARSLAQRAVDETQDELRKVMSRVDNIYGSYENFSPVDTINSTFEYVDGIQELEEILKDHIKKNKYKQQITVFIVGYQDVCHQKLVLLQQVNEFFMTNAKNFEKEDWSDPIPEVDLDEVSTKIEDSLNTAEELTTRLGEINKEMVNYLTNYAIHKGGHKAKKKVEKSLQQAKEDLNAMSEKLLAAHADLEEKEEKISSLMKQAETKHMEIQRYKTAAEVAKKSLKDTEKLQDEFDRRGRMLQECQNKIESLELELTQTNISKDKSEERFQNSGQDNLNKIAELQQMVEEKQLALEEAKRDLQKLHEMQILQLRDSHREEMDELRKKHTLEVRQLLEKMANYQQRIADLETQQASQPGSVIPEDEPIADLGDPSAADLGDRSATDLGDPLAGDLVEETAVEAQDDQSVSGKISRTSSKEKRKKRSRSERSKSRSNSRETRSVGKDTQRSQSSVSSKKSAGTSKQSSKTAGKPKKDPEPDRQVYEGKEYAEASVQDEGGDPDAATVSFHQLDMVREDTGDFSNAYHLNDEESWANVPQEHMSGRFIQYRKLTRKRLADLEDQLSTTVTKTHKKVETLKSQFKDHKAKWEAERSVLVKQIEQAMKLQSEAENEADTAMGQLEEFIIEQEKLENLEDLKHEELSRQTTKLADDAQAQLAAQNKTKETSETPSGRASTAKGDNAASTPEIAPHPETEELEKKSASGQSEQKVHVGQADEEKVGQADEEKEGQTDRRPDSVRPSSGVKEEPELTKLLQQTDDAKVQELKRSATTLGTTPTIETPEDEGNQRSQSAQVEQQSALEVIVQNLQNRICNEAYLEPQQAKALWAIREALKLSTNEKALSRLQMTHTLAIISLAAQLAEEALRLEVKPSYFFNLFGKLNTAARKVITSTTKMKGMTTAERNMFENSPQPLELGIEDTVVLGLSDEADHVGEEDAGDSIDETDIFLADPTDSHEKERWAAPSNRPHSLRSAMSRSSLQLPSVLLSNAELSDKTQTSSQHALASKPLGTLPHVDAPGADVTPHKITPNVIPLEAAGVRTMVDVFTQWDERDLGLTVSPASTEPTANEALNLSGMTNEDIRAMSSKSRASLRSQYKSRLEETKLAVEDRRSKSPAISIPSLHSLDDDQLVEDEEFDLPVMEERKEGSRLDTAEKGTSPPQTPRKPSLPPTPVTQPTPLPRIPSAIKGDHPIVQEYLETYDGVVNFKDDLTKLLIDKDMMTASQVLSDLETMTFDHGDEVEPQLRKMTTNLHCVLDELRSVLGTVLINEREPAVSSVVSLSREPTQTNLLTREKSEDSGRGLTRSRSALSGQSDKCLTCQNENVKELRETCTLLQRQLDMQAKKHEEQMRINKAIMMGMQKTIEELQRELAELTREKEAANQEPPPEPAIMFTRLDSERNSKIMKRALYEDRLDTDKFKEAVNQMDQYVSLPAQRLAQLVRRYMHHRRMKEIEDNVRHSKSLNQNVFEILDKMENLQNKRAKQWTDNMDALGVERYRLASLLMETFDNIEQESGIFLIKPIYSFKGRDFREKFGGKLSRLNRPTRDSSPARDGCRSAMAPAPTPATNTRPGTRSSYQGKVNHTQSETALFARHAQFEPTTGVAGLGMVWNIGQPRPVWNLNNSQAKELSVDNLATYTNQNYNTPRILELDINRMLIGQNNVSTRMAAAGLTDDRLVNATNNSVRSYVTVNRPTVPPGQNRFTTDGAVPPSTPHRPASVGHRRKIPSSPPLPPIHVRHGSASRLIEGQTTFGNLSGSEQDLTPISAV